MLKTDIFSCFTKPKVVLHSELPLSTDSCVPIQNYFSSFPELEEAYVGCGFQAKFFTETGVSNADGKSVFLTNSNWSMKEWGGQIESTDPKSQDQAGKGKQNPPYLVQHASVESLYKKNNVCLLSD